QSPGDLSLRRVHLNGKPYGSSGHFPIPSHLYRDHCRVECMRDNRSPFSLRVFPSLCFLLLHPFLLASHSPQAGLSNRTPFHSAPLSPVREICIARHVGSSRSRTCSVFRPG